jgi:hypothetical protein
MTEEDREYFKTGAKTLCGTELMAIRNFINDKDMKKRIDRKDLEFMNSELGKQAGAIWAKLLRALKKRDYVAAVEVIRGKRGGSGGKESMETEAQEK